MVKVEDTTAPSVSAALEPIAEDDGDAEDDDDAEDEGDVGDDDDAFKVVFGCSDLCDADPTIISADINGVPVTNGQTLELVVDEDAQTVEVDDGVVTISAPSFVLTVTCTDASGNVGTATVSPVFADDDGDEG